MSRPDDKWVKITNIDQYVQYIPEVEMGARVRSRKCRKVLGNRVERARQARIFFFNALSNLK